MARRTTARCRECRREGQKLFLKGTRCSTDKCAVDRRGTTPGMHGTKGGRRKASNYSIQMREKQKAKRIYGIFERQFKNYFLAAEKTRGATGDVLLQLLERRLDNVVYRSNFADSRSRARQLVNHRFVKVNGRKVSISSYSVRMGDKVEMAGSDEQLKAIRETTEKIAERSIPEWIDVSKENLSLTVKRLPARKDSGAEIQESIIIELYSK